MNAAISSILPVVQSKLEARCLLSSVIMTQSMIDDYRVYGILLRQRKCLLSSIDICSSLTDVGGYFSHHIINNKLTESDRCDALLASKLQQSITILQQLQVSLQQYSQQNFAIALELLGANYHELALKKHKIAEFEQNVANKISILLQLSDIGFSNLCIKSFNAALGLPSLVQEIEKSSSISQEVSSPIKRIRVGTTENDSVLTPLKLSDTSQVTPATDTTASRENNTQIEESQHYIITQDDPDEEERQTQHTALSSSPPTSSQEISFNLNCSSVTDSRTMVNRCGTW